MKKKSEICVTAVVRKGLQNHVRWNQTTNSLALNDKIAVATRFAQRNVSMDRPGSSFHFLLVFTYKRFGIRILLA